MMEHVTADDIIRAMREMRAGIFADLLRRKRTTNGAIDLLMSLARCKFGDRFHPGITIETCQTTPRVRFLMRYAFERANLDLGCCWRGRYVRAARWLTAERKRRWLEMSIPRDSRRLIRQRIRRETKALWRSSSAVIG